MDYRQTVEWILTEGGPFQVTHLGVGMLQFHNDEIALVGGLRTFGSGAPGTNRLKFSIVDLPPGAEPVIVGECEINLYPDNTPEGLVNVKIQKTSRGGGIGRKLIAALVASSRDGLRIYDIKKSAMGFWKSVGIINVAKDKKSLTQQVNGFIPKIGT